MKLNFAFNKPNSFFKDKKAKVTKDLMNGLDESISSGSEVTIISKAPGFKIFFNIQTDSGVYIDRVSYEDLEIIKTEKK